MDIRNFTQPVLIGIHRAEGDLTLPPQARALIVFVHGSGSSRNSPRNRQVAQALQAHGLGTLLFDLLSPDEAASRSTVFNVPLLGERLVEVLDWANAQTSLHDLPVGLFGASTGAAAALYAAAARPDRIYAVVSRGGRPDLAAAVLPRVMAPTRLIVGGADPQVMTLNRWARKALGDNAELSVVPGASHLFEEPGALDQVSIRAAEWFLQCLRPRDDDDWAAKSTPSARGDRPGRAPAHG
ncbi:MAG TPA: alpha/beta fold hydrolase [Roseateles sp.]